MLSGKIFIKTFGCQMNEYDSNRIYDSVSKLGFVKTNNQYTRSWSRERRGFELRQSLEQE